MPADTALRGLALAAKHLSGVPGRKTLIWVSVGFSMKGMHSDEMMGAVKILNDSNVALYSVDAAGLQTGFWDATVRVPNGPCGAPEYNFQFVLSASRVHTFEIYANQSTMLELSDRTGGRAFLGSNNIAGSIQSSIKDLQGSYRLGFYPSDINFDGHYHDIRVKLVNRPDVRLRYRRGYFDSRASRNPKSLVRDALMSPVLTRGIPLTGGVDGQFKPI